MPSTTIPMNSTIDPFQVLQVRRDATLAELRQAYRQRALWHHPGRRRRCTTADSLKEQYRIFQILAASYETLMDPEARRRCTVLLNEQQQQQQQQQQHCLGDVRVGGRRLDQPSVPHLTSSSSSSSTDTKSTATTADPEQHYTGTETNRMFGGPLELLYRARRWKTFTDPYQLFAAVFGSHALQQEGDSTIHCKDHDYNYYDLSLGGKKNQMGSLDVATATAMDTAPVALASEQLPDGTVIHTTTRIVRNRKIIRTQVTEKDLRTGKKRSFITVTSEDLTAPGSSSSSSSRCTRQQSEPATTVWCSDWDASYCLCGTVDTDSSWLPGVPESSVDLSNWTNNDVTDDQHDDQGLFRAVQSWLPTCV